MLGQTELNILNYHAEPLTYNVHCICLTGEQCIQQYFNLCKYKNNFYPNWGVPPGGSCSKEKRLGNDVLLCYVLWDPQTYNSLLWNVQRFPAFACREHLNFWLCFRGTLLGGDLSDLNISLLRFLAWFPACCTYLDTAISFLSSKRGFTCLSPPLEHMFLEVKNLSQTSFSSCIVLSWCLADIC